MLHEHSQQDCHIGTARKMSVDIDATPCLLLLIQQKLRIVQYRYGSLSAFENILPKAKTAQVS